MAIAFLKLTQISTRATNDMRIFVVSGINKQKEVRGLNWCFISGCVVKKIQKVPKCQSGKREEEGGFKLVSMFCLAGAALGLVTGLRSQFSATHMVAVANIQHLIVLILITKSTSASLSQHQHH